MAILVFSVFREALIRPQGRVVGAPDTDLILHFVASRAFGFGELANGNLPLWNPRMFSGYPYFGGFQPALLYPPNWLYLLLPLDVAINWGIALHVFLGGWFTFLWLRAGGTGVGRVPAAAGGVAFMFCARFFLHVYAGHLPHICLVPWVALLLWSVDGLARTARLRWALSAALSGAMMLLAGYPQMAYFALMVLPVYGAWRVVEASRRGRVIVGLTAAGALSLALCAAQLWAGAEAIGESVRQERSYEFAATFSFPPENLLTLVAPHALGKLPLAAVDESTVDYFGQAYLWEVSTHVGAVVGVMALLGALFGGRARAGLPVLMVLLTGVLGLGANTPLHRWMYDHFPGFASFRGSSKFFYLASLFVVQLAALGLDAIGGSRAVASRWRPWAPVAVAAGVAVTWLLLAAAVHVSTEPGGWFARAVERMAQRAVDRKDWYGPDPSALVQPEALARIARTTRHALTTAGAWTGVAAVAIAFAAWRPRGAPFAVTGLVAAIIAESTHFAVAHRPLCSMEASLPPPWPDALAQLEPVNRFVRNPSVYDYRGPALSQTLDAWGYDPGVLERYAALMSVGQGLAVDAARWGLYFSRPAPSIFRLARVTLVLSSRPLGAFLIDAPALPPACLVPNVIVLPASADDPVGNRDAILAALSGGRFDPSNTILLERDPGISIAGGARGAVTIEAIDTDTRVIRFEASAPAVLLVTEAYSRHWVVRALVPPPEGQPRGRYAVMPGNWAFIAIPVSAGRHELELSFEPRGWMIGRWVSLTAVIVFTAAAVGVWWQDRRRKTVASLPGEP